MANPIFYGSPDFTANGNLTLVENSFQRDPASLSYTLTWKGTEAAVGLKTQQIVALGAKASQSKIGGQYSVTGTFWADPTQPPETEIPNDTYTFGTEAAQVDLYAHPRARAYLIAEGTANMAAMRNAMELFISTGKPTKVPDPSGSEKPIFDSSPAGLAAGAIYDARSIGETHYTLFRPIFRRRREYSLQYAQKRKIENLPKFYLRSSLIRVFEIPAAVASLIPDDPTDTAAVGTVWGWRKRVDDGEIVQTKRGAYVFQESLDFEFGGISTYFSDEI